MSSDRTRNIGVHGPERDRIIDESAAQRNGLAPRAPHQPDASESAPGARDATDAARSSNDATGAEDGPSHLGEAEEAFERSRGDGRDRDAAR